MQTVTNKYSFQSIAYGHLPPVSSQNTAQKDSVILPERHSRKQVQKHKMQLLWARNYGFRWWKHKIMNEQEFLSYGATYS